MINLLPINRLIAAISVIYCATIAITIGFVADNSTPATIYKNISIAAAGSSALSVVLLFIFHIGWKWLWRRFPVLNTILFPNLDGTWDMSIHYTTDEKSGTVIAKAIIKQDFLKMSMEVESPGSDSKTLIAQPKKDPESGRPFLYYVYQVEPKRIGTKIDESYIGSATLRYSNEDMENLCGNYFTSAKTHGHFKLTKSIQTI